MKTAKGKSLRKSLKGAYDYDMAQFGGQQAATTSG